PFCVPHTLRKGGYNFSAGRRGFMDSMALVSAMDQSFYGKHRNGLGPIEPSNKILRMADGSKRKSEGLVRVEFVLTYDGGRIVTPVSMEVVESAGAWDVLFGLPMMVQTRAVIDFGERELRIKGGADGGV
ncbi:hypothetical protein HD553DRAFT_254482, partial [Filobasidium floriforme]|uniref:uncharacterized protein n=1 Tax=Filobasidium floriforme TaxID=5210 RepID=UPI001E8D8DD2